MSFSKTQRLITLPDVGVKIIEALPDTVAALPAATNQGEVDLLDALNSVRRCLIVGNSDEGKTTLLQWIVARRLATSKVAVIDPHTWPGKWQDGVSVVGQGRDYLAIDRALSALLQKMTKRYGEIGRGEVAEMGHEPITIVIDEWRAITGNLNSAGNVIKTLLTESRKAAFSIFVASHSDRARPLGLEGEYDLKDGFCIIRLARAGDVFSATIDKGDGPIPARLPGPYHVVDSEPLDLEPEPNPQERFILRSYEAGESVSAIAEKVFGSKGGNQNAKVKNVLLKNGTV